MSCTDYNLICSGTELCNDMFDCVTKHSLLKNSIVYDYDAQEDELYASLLMRPEYAENWRLRNALKY